jgi:hypothetical protein
VKRRADARRTGGERTPVRRSTSLARLVSIALHPFVVSPLTVALATRNWRATAFVGAVTILPILAVTLWNLRRGVWSDFDVSRRDQRSGLYWIAIPLFAAAGLFLPAPPWFARSMLALVCVLVLALAAGRLLKTSLHMLFMLFCSVVLVKAYPWSPAVMLPLVLTLAWSRWHLQRHTPWEIAAGSLLGLAAGLYTIS